MRHDARFAVGLVGFMGMCLACAGATEWVRVDRPLGRAESPDGLLVAEIAAEEHTGEPFTRLTVRRASDASWIAVEVPGQPTGTATPVWTAPDRVEFEIDGATVAVLTRGRE